MVESGRVVFVIGAGASKEFGLPIGSELTGSIAALCDIRYDDWGTRLVAGNPEFIEILQGFVRRAGHQGRGLGEYLHEAWRIRNNMPLAPSIDNFLDTHRDNPKLISIGKLALTFAILQAEKRSKLASRDDVRAPLDFKSLDNTWLMEMFRVLVSQRDFASFSDVLSRSTFISFNYDRCIHQFFFHAVRSYFNVTPEVALDLVQKLDIVYIYGTVGKFRQTGSPAETSFGNPGYGEAIIDASSQVKTFTEGAASEEAQRVSDAMHGASVIVFLGFGFLPINMELLLAGPSHPNKRIIGTSLGLSVNSTDLVDQEITDWLGDNLDDLGVDRRVELENVNCTQLIRNYSRFLLREFLS